MFRNNVTVFIFLKVALTVFPNTALICTPEIVEGSHSKLDVDGNTSLECDISTCKNVSLIKYEKQFKETNPEWIPVFEGINDTYNHALDTGVDFTLENRNDYKAFRTHHLLYVYPLNLQDHGEWRCVVVQRNNMTVESNAIDLNFAPICTPKMIKGSHSRLKIDGHTFLECIISTCESVSKIVYEKTGLNELTNWTQVYEGINKTSHHALKTGTGYYLRDRSDYTAFLTQHILYIKPLKSKDDGDWRCVVYDKNEMSTESQPTDLNFAPACTPVIFLGSYITQAIGGHASFECDIYTCTNVWKIVYEKRGIYQHTEWTPVFEGIDNTNNHALPNNNYTLIKRNDYVAFHTKHMLYINPLILEDDGVWRCVVYDKKNRTAQSQPIDFNIYATPKNESIVIRSTVPAIVTNQTPKVVFTCEVDGIYPEPDVVWLVNGTEYYEGVSGNTQEKDGLWSVYDTIPLQFGQTGKVNISCEMRIKQTRDRWVGNNKIFDVKEAACVIFPIKSIKKVATAKDPFTLECSGAGYTRQISWAKDGENIADKNESFIIDSNCDTPDRICNSTLSSKPFETPASCKGGTGYMGSYTCTVHLQPPYDKSSDISPSTRVDILGYIDAGLCSDVSMECDVCSGGDESNVSWSFGDVQLGHDKVFVIRGVSEEDFGIYTKTVKTMEGEFTCNTELQFDESKNAFCEREIKLIRVGGMMILLLCVIVFVGCIVRWRCKKKQRDQEGREDSSQKEARENVDSSVDQRGREDSSQIEASQNVDSSVDHGVVSERTEDSSQMEARENFDSSVDQGGREDSSQMEASENVDSSDDHGVVSERTEDSSQMEASDNIDSSDLLSVNEKRQQCFARSCSVDEEELADRKRRKKNVVDEEELAEQKRRYRKSDFWSVNEKRRQGYTHISSEDGEELAEQKRRNRKSGSSACMELQDMSSSTKEQQNKKPVNNEEGDALLPGDKRVKNQTSFSNIACNETVQELQNLLDKVNNIDADDH